MHSSYTSSLPHMSEDHCLKGPRTKTLPVEDTWSDMVILVRRYEWPADLPAYSLLESCGAVRNRLGRYRDINYSSAVNAVFHI